MVNRKSKSSFPLETITLIISMIKVMSIRLAQVHKESKIARLKDLYFPSKTC